MSKKEWVYQYVHYKTAAGAVLLQFLDVKLLPIRHNTLLTCIQMPPDSQLFV